MEELETKSLYAKELQRILEENPFIRVSDAVFQVLEDAILSSGLKPGSKLNINKLAEDLQVSSTPVREAVDHLLSRGLVTESRGAGGKYRNYYVFDIDDDAIAELFVARRIIEATAAYICAEQNWYVDLPKLKKAVLNFQRTLKEHLEGAPVYPEAVFDQEFHDMLVEAAHNRYLSQMYESLSKNLRYLSVRTCEFIEDLRNRDHLLRLCNQHMAIYQAIEMGFPDLAKKAMEDHIDFCAESCLKNRRGSRK